MAEDGGVAFNREINNLIWQPEILARIEIKGLFRALANRPSAHKKKWPALRQATELPERRGTERWDTARSPADQRYHHMPEPPRRRRRESVEYWSLVNAAIIER